MDAMNIFFMIISRRKIHAKYDLNAVEIKGGQPKKIFFRVYKVITAQRANRLLDVDK